MWLRGRHPCCLGHCQHPVAPADRAGSPHAQGAAAGQWSQCPECSCCRCLQAAAGAATGHQAISAGAARRPEQRKCCREPARCTGWRRTPGKDVSVCHLAAQILFELSGQQVQRGPPPPVGQAQAGVGAQQCGRGAQLAPVQRAVQRRPAALAVGRVGVGARIQQRLNQAHMVAPDLARARVEQRCGAGVRAPSAQ